MHSSQILASILFIVGLSLSDPVRAVPVVVLLFAWTLFVVRGSRHRAYAEKLLVTWMVAECTISIVDNAFITRNRSGVSNAGLGLVCAAALGFTVSLLARRWRKKPKPPTPASIPDEPVAATEPRLQESVAQLQIATETETLLPPPRVFVGVSSV